MTAEVTSAPIKPWTVGRQKVRHQYLTMWIFLIGLYVGLLIGLLGANVLQALASGFIYLLLGIGLVPIMLPVLLLLGNMDQSG